MISYKKGAKKLENNYKKALGILENKIPSAIVLECRLYKGNYVFIISSKESPCRIWMEIDPSNWTLYSINEGSILLKDMDEWLNSEVLFEKELKEA